MLLSFIITLPSGQSATRASLKFSYANGIPMMVIAKSTPVVICARASSQPSSTSHNMLNSILHPETLSSSILVPKGRNATLASLISEIPKGIPIIVIINNIPPRKYTSA
ncbi:hypothetical protein AX774_g4329 [Zancudomyces culisetae]|uniref:Uncharacterized protein n=1 Tax=Zancudomyces culisetae TaxID=1213189 RepID=A0A1R1PML4_ZANCU|nr:hypothetical protein AX774_g4329 [Zancudomyces culisetae]|eukprot:OMH82210.1 hypothetical protein AX774_g4329 [Zancudomyces culisetae]